MLGSGLIKKMLIRPIHRGLTLINNLLRLAGVMYFMPTDASSGYHNLKLDEQSSYLKTFSSPFGRYRYIQLTLSVIPAGDMFQRKIDELFQGLPNMFSFLDSVLIAGFNNMDGDYDAALNKVLRTCRQPNLKLNKDRCLFWHTNILFFGEVISWHWVSLDPRQYRHWQPCHCLDV